MKRPVTGPLRQLHGPVLERTLRIWGWIALLAGVALFVFALGSSPKLWIEAVGAILLAGGGWAIKRAADAAGAESLRHVQAIKTLQERLSQDRSAIDALADGLDVAVFVCDDKAAIQYANKRAQDMFRLADPQGRTLLAATLSYDLEALVFEVLRTGTPIQAELTFSYPEESVNIASAWVEPGSTRVFLTIYEVTDLRRLERVRRDFVANVSHELRTPLATIRAMAETLHDDQGADPELSERYLAKIMSEVDRLSLIANDLLILSAAESNPVRKHACDFAEVVQNSIAELDRKAKAKGLILAYEGPTHLLIEANAAQLSQVVLNLIENALNYTAEGNVKVHLLSEGESAILEVADTGIGIASQHLPRIFERFYRVDKGRSRVTGGTGLGLSIVKHIVEAHGGNVTVESALNQGSRFRVTLPVGDTSQMSVNEA